MTESKRAWWADLATGRVVWTPERGWHDGSMITKPERDTEIAYRVVLVYQQYTNTWGGDVGESALALIRELGLLVEEYGTELGE